MFSGPFRASFVRAVAAPDAVVEPWYLAGGVALASCKRAYQPVGAASLAVSYVNLVSPGTGDAAPGVAPTHASATGWAFNGTTQYLTTGYTPPAQTAFSMVIRFSGGATSGSHALIAVSDTVVAQNLGIFQRLGGSTFYIVNGAGPATPASVTSGVIGMTGTQGYLNGAAYGAAITTAIKTWNPLLIGDYSTVAGVPAAGYYFSGNVQAVAIYNVDLTAAQILAISTAAAALTG